MKQCNIPKTDRIRCMGRIMVRCACSVPTCELIRKGSCSHAYDAACQETQACSASSIAMKHCVHMCNAHGAPSVAFTLRIASNQHLFVTFSRVSSLLWVADCIRWSRLCVICICLTISHLRFPHGTMCVNCLRGCLSISRHAQTSGIKQRGGANCHRSFAFPTGWIQWARLCWRVLYNFPRRLSGCALPKPVALTGPAPIAAPQIAAPLKL